MVSHTFTQWTELQLKVSVRARRQAALGITAFVLGACGSRSPLDPLIHATAPMDAGPNDAQQAAMEDAQTACPPGLFAMATGQNTPAEIAVGPSGVYWNDWTNTVRRIGLCGGTPDVLVRGNDIHAYGLAVESAGGARVFWSTGSAIDELLGGRPGPFAPGEIAAADFVVGTTDLYWVTSSATPSGTIQRAPLAGGTPTTLATGLDSPGGLAVNSTDIYWTSHDTGTVVRMPISGGTPVTIVYSSSGPSSLVLDSTSLYWTNNDLGGIFSTPLLGYDTVTLVPGARAAGLATDGVDLYWTSGGVSCPSDGAPCAGTVQKIAVGGGTPVTLATGQGIPGSIALYGTSVYWLNEVGDGSTTDGAVMRFTPR